MNEEQSFENIEIALQLSQLNTFTHIVVVLLTLWGGAYICLSWYFLKCFRDENLTLWRSMGCPTIFRKNLALYRLIFTKQLKRLQPKTQAYGRLIRYMTYVGVIVAIGMPLSFYLLYGHA